MSSEQQDFYKWMQDLAARSVDDQTRALQQYNDLVQRLLRGELNDPRFGEEFARFAREQSTRYASDLAQLSLSYYGALLELGHNYSDRFYDQMLHSRQPKAQPENGGEPANKPRQVTLELQGAVGQEAAVSFVIENKRDAQAEISFLVSEFVDLAGGSPFRAPLQLQPDQFVLGPREEAAVKIRLPLPDDLFLPGHQYHAAVVVHGYAELELILSVRLNPTDEATLKASSPGISKAAEPEAETPGPQNRPPGRGGGANQRRTKATSNSRAQRNRTGGSG